MFSPRDRELERGWPGRIEGDRVIQLAAQTLQSFFTGGGGAREHAEYRLDERIKFCGEPPALIGDIGGRNAGVVTRGEVISVGELDFELGQGLGPAVLPLDFDPLAQVYEGRVARILGAVRAEARRIDPGQRHRHGLAQAELALQPIDRSGNVADPRATGI